MTSTSSSAPHSTGRLTSLDAMRGFTMMSMVLVNNPGDWGNVYSPLLHVSWHGCSFTDLIFPFFLFIVGVAMPFSFERRIAEGGRDSLFPKIVRRTLILFGIGVLLSVFPRILIDPNALDHFRIPGVLQRIALCYFAVSIITLYLGMAGRIAAGVALVVLYWLGMAFFPVPGYGAGIYEPEGNLCWWLDNLLLFGFTWRHVPAEGFDPEGVWSTLTAIVTTLLGYFAGLWLRSQHEPHRKLVGLFIAGNLAMLLAYCLTPIMPINKQLWTVPYMLLTAGLAVHCLAMFYYFIDIRGYNRGLTPLLIFGSNAIFAYVLSMAGSSVLDSIQVGDISLKAWIFQNAFLPWASPINASLAMGLAYTLFCMAVTGILYYKRIFIRI